MDTNRRSFLIAGASAAAAFSLQSGRTEAAEASLNVLYTDPQFFRGVQEPIARGFEALNPGISVNLLAVADYGEALQRVLRSAVTGGMPDVAFHGYSNMPLLARRGLLLQLDGRLPHEPPTSDPYDSAVARVGRVDGKLYGLPFCLSVPVVLFNLDLVHAAGGDPDQLPDTWDGLFALAQRAKDENGGIYFNYDTDGGFTFMNLVQSLGGHVLSSDGQRLTLATREALAALRLLATIGKIRHGRDMSKLQARQAFAAKALTILVDSSSLLYSVARAAAGNFAISIGALPRSPGDAVRLSPSGIAATVMATDPAKQALALRYIEHAIDAESQNLMARHTGFAPTNLQTVDRPDLLPAWIKTHPNLRTVVDAVPNLTAPTPWPGNNGRRIDLVLTEELRNVMSLKSTAEAAQQSLIASITPLLPER